MVSIHFSYSTPYFTWKAGLKYNGVKLDFIADDTFRLLLENNIRVGPISCIGRRLVKRVERKTVYYDMTNLYGWSMSQYLPRGDFHEIECTKRNERNIVKTVLRTPDNKCGYLLECHLEDPSNIHEKNKTLPISSR